MLQNSLQLQLDIYFLHVIPLINSMFFYLFIYIFTRFISLNTFLT